MMLERMKNAANVTFTENGAVTYRSTGSDCLDFFAAAGALRGAAPEEIIARFLRAYAEDADLALKALFFARDIRGGLGERRLFRVIFRWLADHEPASCRKNIPCIGEYGRLDDVLCLFGTACETDMLAFVRTQLEKDLEALASGAGVSLLAKWLPSVNTSNREAVSMGKKIARSLRMTDAQYRKTLSSLRAGIRILENRLRVRDYSFDYAAQPSGALFRYRKAFFKNDQARYLAFLDRVRKDPSLMHTGTLTPYDVIAPILSGRPVSEEERRSLDAAWNALEGHAGNQNVLVVVDGSGSMYHGRRPLPAAVAQSLGIYFAERNTGFFHNHFITFSAAPRLVEIKGKDIVGKVRYCMSFNECSNTDLEKVFDLVLGAAVRGRVPQKELPSRILIVSDMEFDCCRHAGVTNFENAKAKFRAAGYRLPAVTFWNVCSRNRQQPVKMNEQGVTLLSGCSPQVFAMVRAESEDPYAFMRRVLGSGRYQPIAA